MRAHGTNACYVWGPEPGQRTGAGCRCAPCRAAARTAQRENRRRLFDERHGLREPKYVPAEAARQHLLWLMDAGYGAKTIAKLAHVPQSTIGKIVYGQRKRLTPGTEAKILAVHTLKPRAGGARIPAGPTWVLIDRLLAAGVPKARIAEEIGQRGPGLQLSRHLVTVKHAGRVEDLYRSGRWRAMVGRRNPWDTRRQVAA